MSDKEQSAKKPKRKKHGGRVAGRNDALVNRLRDENGTPIFLTTDETAQLLGVHREQILRLARAGQLPAKKIGTAWRIRADLLMKV